MVVVLGDETDVESLHFTGLEPVNIVDRPGCLEVGAGFQEAAGARTEAFQHGLFARFDEDDTRRRDQHKDPDRRPLADLLADRLVKPRLGHLEAELVVERLAGRAEEGFRLADNSHEAAVIEDPRDLALHPRPIDLGYQGQQCLGRNQTEEHQEQPREVEVVAGISDQVHRQRRGHEERDVGPEQHVAAARPEQPLVVQAGQARSVFADEEQDQAGQAGRGHRDRRALLAHVQRRRVQVTPQPPGPEPGSGTEKDREDPHEILLEHLARLPGRKGVRFVRAKEVGRALLAVQLVELELLEPFPLLQTHLEERHQRYQKADGQKDAGHQAGRRLHIPRRHERHRRGRKEDEPVHQPDSEVVLLHVLQLSSRSSNRIIANASAAPQ